MINYIAALDHALLDEKLLAHAQAWWGEIAADVMSRNHDRTPGSLRTSDAGRCVRDLWADIHDRYTLTENPEDLLLKMNQGTLSGAWQACLIAAALRADGYGVLLEHEIQVPGDPPRTGHADIAVWDKGAVKVSRSGFASWSGPCLEVVDCKWTAWSGEIDPPDVKSRYQVLSTCSYALELGAPSFVILTSAPASRKEKRKQWRYYTEEWALDVAAEYQRVAPALADAMPEGDPQEPWRCKKCRFGACDRNENPARITESVDIIVDLTKSLEALA